MNFNTSSRNISLGVRGGVGDTRRDGLSISAGGGGGGHPVHGGVKYVYELPYLERKEICRIFDANNDWERLGGALMGYPSTELSEFGRAFLRGGSPTDALLNAWGSQNHTILELFTLFARLTHYRAMKVIARFVDPKYHAYIRDPEVNATQELIQLDTPVSPGAVGGGGIGVPVELKVQNIGFHHHNHHPDSPKKLDAGKNDIAPEGKGKEGLAASLVESVGHLPQIPYAELLAATNNWERRNILGKGGFGTVYKGMWKNTSVAIKRMEQRANHAYVESQMKQSLGELRCLNSCRHDNILPLYGFSLEGEHPCLVYQFMVNGSLEDRLLCRHKSMPLLWSTRYQIARGVACGIQFLHSIGEKPLIHGDIKSANILLDKNFEARIGDFGLAREMPSNESYVKVSRVHGTRPYLPDEYLRSKKLSTKVDTYSFGIMVFEIGTGQRAYEESRSKKFLREVVEDAEGNYEPLRDPKGGPENPDIFWHFIKVGRSCTEKIAKNRPEMVQVLKAFDMFLSQHSTQASSIRTVSSQVTGIPLLFETPNSRPGSLLIPGGTGSTTHRLSPEMRATSPYWMPQSQAQAGYQTPPTISTNQSIPQQISNASAHNNNTVKPPTNQQGGGAVVVGYSPQQGFYPPDLMRRSPLPSIPQMGTNNNGVISNVPPGMYQLPSNPYIPPSYLMEAQPVIPFNIGGNGFQVLNQPPSISPGRARVRTLSQQQQQQQQGQEQANDIGQPHPTLVGSPPEALKFNEVPAVPSVVGGSSHPQPSISKPSNYTTPPETRVVEAHGEKQDAFLPVFLIEKQEEGEGKKGDGSEDEDHNEWTNDFGRDEEDGPATAIPLITELGIKDNNDS